MKVTEIQRFCMHDGPGVRTVVFLKGCPLRCAWCHNPETQSVKREMLFYSYKCICCGACVTACQNGAHSIDEESAHLFDRTLCEGCGKCAEVCCTKALVPSYIEMTVDEVFAEIEKDRAFYGDVGGVTLSGGEPMMQSDESFELLQKCREDGINTAVETCGYFECSLVPRLVSLSDCLLWDFKDADDERHMKYTGVSNEKIINNLLLADSLGAETILRCIMVNGVNMNDKHYGEIATLWNRLENCRYVELIPYHAYGGSKMLALGEADNGRIEWIPSDKALENAKMFLKDRKVRLK